MISSFNLAHSCHWFTKLTDPQRFPVRTEHHVVVNLHISDPCKQLSQTLSDFSSSQHCSLVGQKGEMTECEWVSMVSVAAHHSIMVPPQYLFRKWYVCLIHLCEVHKLILVLLQIIMSRSMQVYIGNTYTDKKKVTHFMCILCLF